MVPGELRTARAVLSPAVCSRRGPRGAGPAAEHGTFPARCGRVPAAPEACHRGQAPPSAPGNQVRPHLGTMPAFWVGELSKPSSLKIWAVKLGWNSHCTDACADPTQACFPASSKLDRTFSAVLLNQNFK